MKLFDETWNMDITTIGYSVTAVVVDFVQSQFLRKSTRILYLVCDKDHRIACIRWLLLLFRHSAKSLDAQEERLAISP